MRIVLDNKREKKTHPHIQSENHIKIDTLISFKPGFSVPQIKLKCSFLGPVYELNLFLFLEKQLKSFSILELS